MSHEARLAALGIALPSPPTPIAIYGTLVVHDGLAYTSGHGPMRADGTLVIGRIGDTLDIAAGRAAARLTGLAMLASLRSHLGSLDRVTRVIKVLGMVNTTPDFSDQHVVIDGFSHLMIQVFGDAATPARSAIGVPSLPLGIAVEIEAIFAVD